MVKTLTRQAVLDLYNSLNATGSLTGARFAYAVAKNIKKLKDEADAINSAYLPTDEFMKYDKERVALAELHSIKNADGKPIILNDKYELLDEEKFNKELKELQEKHPGVVDARQKQLDEFAAFLKEEVEVELHVIEPEYLPQDISTAQMAGILSIVEEALKN